MIKDLFLKMFKSKEDSKWWMFWNTNTRTAHILHLVVLTASLTYALTLKYHLPDKVTTVMLWTLLYVYCSQALSYLANKLHNKGEQK